jgi:hypothetical protein
MLFEAYEDREMYEEEIDTARLFARYWQSRVWAQGRRALRATEPLSAVARAKDRLCRELAFRLFTTKRLDFEETAVAGVTADPANEEAWRELRSDGVITQPLKTRRQYQFFHETFLEYAAARHIASVPAGRSAAAWLIDHFLRTRDFFVAPVISHLGSVDPGLAPEIANRLYSGGGTTAESPLYAKRLAIDIFSNVDSSARREVGDLLSEAVLSDHDQSPSDWFVQRVGHLPAVEAPLAVEVLCDRIWERRKTKRSRMLLLQALAALARGQPGAVWGWVKGRGRKLLEFPDADRSDRLTFVSVALRMMDRCFSLGPDEIVEILENWYADGGDKTRAEIAALLARKLPEAPGVWETIEGMLREEAGGRFASPVAHSVGEGLLSLDREIPVDVVTRLREMLDEQGPVGEIAAAVLGVIADHPSQGTLFDSLWRAFIDAGRSDAGVLYNYCLRGLAQKAFDPLVERLRTCPPPLSSYVIGLCTDCPGLPSLGLDDVRHLLDGDLRDRMTAVRALAKGAAVDSKARPDFWQVLNSLTCTRTHSSAIGLMQNWRDVSPEDVAALMHVLDSVQDKNEAKELVARTLAGWLQYSAGRPNPGLVAAASEALRRLLRDRSTKVQERTVEALAWCPDFAPAFADSILEATRSPVPGIRQKAVRVLRAAGNTARLVVMGRDDPVENIRHDALIELAAGLTEEESLLLVDCVPHIETEAAVSPLRAWCHVATAAARFNGSLSCEIICAVLRRCAALSLSRDAQRTVAKNLAVATDQLALAARGAEVASFVSTLRESMLQALGTSSQSIELVSGVVEGLARALPLGSPVLQRLGGDSVLPDLCKKPIHRRESELRHQASEDLTPLVKLLEGRPSVVDPVKKRIFLSAVTSQFEKCRDVLNDDLCAAGFHVDMRENLQQGGGSLLEKLESYIDDCDLFIAIVGDAYGWEPEDEARPPGSPRRSYAQWEYLFAQGEHLDGSTRKRKDCLVYVASPEFLAQHRVDEPGGLSDLQREFVTKVRRGCKDQDEFSSLDELRWRVLRDSSPEGAQRARSAASAAKAKESAS